LLHGLPHHLVKAYGVRQQILTAQPAVVQDVLYHFIHVLRGVDDAPQKLAALRVCCLRAVFQKYLGKTLYGTKRSTQVVRHGVGKGIKLPVDFLKLCRPLGNAPLQL